MITKKFFFEHFICFAIIYLQRAISAEIFFEKIGIEIYLHKVRQNSASQKNLIFYKTFKNTALNNILNFMKIFLK